MNYYEVRNVAIDEVLAHKKIVERLAEEYLLKVLENAEIKAIYDEIKDLKRNSAKDEITPKENKKIQDCIAKKHAELKALFKKYNVKANKLVAKYWCKDCKDSGYIKGEVCNCIKARTTNMLMSVDGIKAVETTFDNSQFDVFDNPKYMQSLYEKAKLFIDKMDTTKYNNFSILGGVGVGKTHLMECMTNYAISQNRYVIYLSAFKLNQMFLNYHTCAMSEKNNILTPLLECEMLCIDDLGCEQLLNNVTIPMLTMLINERNIASKKTIITSNLSLDEIRERYDYRLCSRLLDKNISITVQIEGKDLRQK